MFIEEKEVGEVRKLAEWQRVLLGAAGVIERQGWCQHTLGSPGGVMCAEAAINVAAGVPFDACLLGVAGEAAAKMREAVGSALYEWNDEEERTKDEVVAKLRAVALAG